MFVEQAASNGYNFIDLSIGFHYIINCFENSRKRFV